jgi:hypothetical protein
MRPAFSDGEEHPSVQDTPKPVSIKDGGPADSLLAFEAGEVGGAVHILILDRSGVVA